jgi:hypothetical protein
MKFHAKDMSIAVLTIVLVASSTGLPVGRTASPPQKHPQQQQQSSNSSVDDTRKREKQIEAQDLSGRGITVEPPKVYDDALLQQMLETAEARLAAIQVFDPTGITARFGAITGASQQISSVGFSAQGLPLPGITTTSKGATGNTVQTTAPGAANSGFTTTSALPSQDVTTTMPQVSPPSVTAPAATTSLPSSFSVSASDILNEQAQLTAEISALRLLIRGSLSDHFMETDGRNRTKKQITLGFPITVNPDKRYKNAVAVVEVEVEPAPAESDRSEIENQVKVDVEEEITSRGETPTEAEVATEVKRRVSSMYTAATRPAVTTLLPREKTYNVASITDKSVSVSGGVATQLLGVSGSLLKARKTFYLVRDQDTVALGFHPTGQNKVGFRWEFRPVLGGDYVKSGLKQPFVQLAFGATPDAIKLGKVTVRTYWRSYDRKKGITKEIIPNSLNEQFANRDIYTYKLARALPTFNSRDVLEDVGGGQVLVKLPGRFLPGTYVRVGSTLLSAGPQFTLEYEGIRFIAPAADLATKEVFIVAHDGAENQLRFEGTTCSPSAPIVIVKDSLKIETVDETTSRLTLKVNESDQEKKRPPRVMVIGSRVFGYSDAPIKREGDTLSAVVPNSLLSSGPEVKVQTLFPRKGCISEPVTTLKPISPERLAVLERGDGATRFLLSGKDLKGIRVVSPVGAMVQEIGFPSDPDTLVSLTLTAEQLKTNKQVMLQRNGKSPFLVSIPDLDPKKPDPPKARERITIDADEAVIDGDGMKDLVKVSFKKFEITSKEIAGDGKSVRLSGLRALGITSTAASQPLVLEFKSGAKTTVTLEVVSTKVETVSK